MKPTIVHAKNQARSRRRYGWPLLLLVLLFTPVGGCKRTAQGAAPSAPRLPELGEQVCLSLKVLARAARADLEAGRPLRPEVETLAGIGWLDGFVVDRACGDVVLLGRRCPTWPTLHLDDLVVSLRGIWGNSSYPYCSLDPRPEDVRRINALFSRASGPMGEEQMEEISMELQRLWGPQIVAVGGVPRDSRQAHTMVDSDYDMKGVCQGLVSLEGITSCIELQLAEAREAIQRGHACTSGPSLARFWFHVKPGEPLFREASGIVRLDQCSVVLLTEAQKATADGTLHDCHTEDPQAQAFVRQFSLRFAEIAEHRAIYADLENLYRLNALLHALRFRQAARAAGLDLSYFLERYAYQRESPMPPTVPGLTNHKKEQTTRVEGNAMYTYVFFPMVCGGVSMEVDVRAKSFRAAGGRELEDLRGAVLVARPNLNALCWQLTALQVSMDARDNAVGPTPGRVWQPALPRDTSSACSAPKSVEPRVRIPLRLNYDAMDLCQPMLDDLRLPCVPALLDFVEDFVVFMGFAHHRTGARRAAQDNTGGKVQGVSSLIPRPQLRQRLTCPTDGGREASLLHWAAINTKETRYGRQGNTIETVHRGVQAPGRQAHRRGRLHVSPGRPATGRQ